MQKHISVGRCAPSCFGEGGEAVQRGRERVIVAYCLHYEIISLNDHQVPEVAHRRHQQWKTGRNALPAPSAGGDGAGSALAAFAPSAGGDGAGNAGGMDIWRDESLRQEILRKAALVDTPEAISQKAV